MKHFFLNIHLRDPQLQDVMVQQDVLVNLASLMVTSPSNFLFEIRQIKSLKTAVDVILRVKAVLSVCPICPNICWRMGSH